MSRNLGWTVKTLLVLIMPFWLLENTASVGSAQQPIVPVKRLDQTTHLTLKGISFSAALATFTQQTHLSVVTDGIPAEKSVTLDIEGSLRKVLDRIADEFDYTWRESAGGVILMNKRFKTSGSVPQTYLREMRQTTNNVLNILQALNPDTHGVDWPALEVSLANTFTPEQTQTLLKGDRLYASALSPEQLQNLRTIINSATFSVECLRWKELLRSFEAMPRSALVVSTANNIKYFRIHDPLTDLNVPEGIVIGPSGFNRQKP